MSNPTPPTEWPPEAGELFAPVRVIGKGGFASVWMAKKKDGKAGGGDDEHVAIKVMEDGDYARREVAILSELSTKYAHPNIVRLLHDFTEAASGSSGHCVVLSLARGPTLHFLLTKFGALGLVVAQSVSRQLIDAVAFLHGHAVIHRDIQPANVIVSGAQMNDDLWWEDELDADGKLSGMANQCRITLVDFGFARALNPKDIKSDMGLKKVLDESDRSPSPDGPEMEQALPVEMSNLANPCVDNALVDSSLSPPESRGRSRTRNTEVFDNSVSHVRIRDLSALGTRNYAAPEILSGIRRIADVLSSPQDSLNESRRQRLLKKKTLGACVSSYGMVADAFSVGATIRHALTGVPPSVDVEEFIQSKNRPVKKLLKSIKKSVTKGKGKRAKRYRSSADLPPEVNDLIRVLTHYDSQVRATVRSVTRHPWIKMQKERGGPGG
ncbi:hypothetical protein ACHAWF_004361 [Thalassiosira exigua]